MARALVAAVLVLISACAVLGQPTVGECPLTLTRNKQIVGCIDNLDLAGAYFASPNCSGAGCTVTPLSNVTQLGTCIGAASSFCGTVDFTGKTVTLPIVTGDSTITGKSHIGSSAAAAAQLVVTQGTPGNEVARFESAASGDDPMFRIFQSRATAAASTATTIDLNLINNAPTLAPCPSGDVCIIEARTVCHCTGGASCTADRGGANISVMTVKNSGGTISLVGAVVVSMATQIDTSSITTIALTAFNPNARVTVTVPASYNHTCHISWLVTNVGT